MIDFEALRPQGAPDPGCVRVDGSGAITIEPKRGDRGHLERLWAAFQERYPHYPTRLARRTATMKSLGARITAKPETSSPKIGRNDVCPCGSGKKYKKCSGAT